MYNLTVDTAHRFFVGGVAVLVHNQNCDFSELRHQAERLKELGATRAERRELLAPKAHNAITDPAVIGEIHRPRTNIENRRARKYYKNNKEYARELWERRTGKIWPLDVDGNPLRGEHTPSLQEGGHPLNVYPGEGPSSGPHMVIGPDGLTDFQRWGKLGTEAREKNRRQSGGG